MRESILRAISAGGTTTAPSRQEIREYVADHVRKVKAHAMAGGNPHQMLLDHQDQIERFVALLPDQAMRDDFVRVYSEEVAAATAQVNRDADAKETAIIKTASRNHVVMASLAVMAMIIAVIVLMQAMG